MKIEQRPSTLTENGALYLLSKREQQQRRRAWLWAFRLALIRGLDWLLTWKKRR